LNSLDRAIAWLSPSWGASRARDRIRIRAASAYEAGERGRLRKQARDFGSGNAAAGLSGVQLRNEARHLDRNHDIVRNGINTLVQNIVGPTGIGIEPQPRNANGDIDEDLVDQIQVILRDWMRRPEVTRQHDWASVQRLQCRTWVRDGECLHQELIGAVPFLEHGGSLPFSIELIEPDLLPFDFSDSSRGIMQGVECNSWGRPIAYHLYKSHPGDPDAMFFPDKKRVSAERIRHLKMIDRIGQRRGISMLASVITRLEDLKDYEESERIAAKIAASMAAFIIKGQPADYPDTGYNDNSGNPVQSRSLRFQPGMVFDDLRVGESVGTIDTNRPNPNLPAHRDGQLRAAAGGMCVSFSSLSKNYNGTYSAQRQELVEQYGAYGVLGYEFVSQSPRPTYERIIAVALASGQLRVKRGTPVAGLTDALYLLPQMPWIDPQKEAEAMALMEDNLFMSGPEIIRRRGANPRDVLDQESAWQTRLRTWGLSRVARTVAAPAAAPTPAPDAAPNPTEENA
jgi:lambda family phage portal protein